jgi:sugar phosphate isomerase/epimerase
VAALSDADFEALAARLQRLALPVPVSDLFVPREIKLTGPAVDEAAQMAYVRKALDRVARLGARTVVLAAKGSVRHVHMANPVKRTFPQRSDEFDYAPFFAHLRTVGYTGRVSIEASSPDFAREAAAA